MQLQTRIRLTEAARTLEELNIAKGFGSNGKVLGPNVYRFGHRDPDTGTWWWGVDELLEIARTRSSASPEEIQRVVSRYQKSHSPESTPPPQDPSRKRPRRIRRAETEERFRSSLIKLEALLRTKVGGGERDTFGQLIGSAEKQHLFARHKIAELSFINTVRNALNHPGHAPITDDELTRATAAADASLTAFTKELSPADHSSATD